MLSLSYSWKSNFIAPFYNVFLKGKSSDTEIRRKKVRHTQDQIHDTKLFFLLLSFSFIVNFLDFALLYFSFLFFDSLLCACDKSFLEEVVCVRVYVCLCVSVLVCVSQ